MAYVVCTLCHGEGYTSKLGAFTSADIDEWYGDDTEEREAFTRAYNRRGGVYDDPCELCKAQRVITPEQAQEWEEESEYRAEREAERRAGC